MMSILMMGDVHWEILMCLAEGNASNQKLYGRMEADHSESDLEKAINDLVDGGWISYDVLGLWMLSPLGREALEDRCGWCDEPGGTRIVRRVCGPRALLVKWHHECFIRSVIGSVGHISRKCSCYPGNDEPAGDPPGLNKRDAARAAFELWRPISDPFVGSN